MDRLSLFFFILASNSAWLCQYNNQWTIPAAIFGVAFIIRAIHNFIEEE